MGARRSSEVQVGFARSRWTPRGVAALAAVALGSCATQPPYQPPAIAVAAEWFNSDPNTSKALPSYPRSEPPGWWSRLNDPAIDTLVEAALADNPTLAQVAATVEEARATLRINRAPRIPQVGFSGTGAHSLAASPQLTGASAAFTENAAVFGPTLAWEVDLWGRIRESARAARDRLEARNADADEARLSLIAQIAAGVLGLRACGYSLKVRDRDIASREIALTLTRARLARGNAAPVDEANAATDLAIARTDRISQAEQCARDVDSLVTLSGREAGTVRALVDLSLLDNPPVPPAIAGIEPPPIEDANPAALMPTPPPMQLAVPATVLLAHPVIISAEREVAARWSEIAVARANRLPKVDLAATLSGNWLQALGVNSFFDTWSVGGSLAVPVIDGGAGAAAVYGSEAAYREALANLRVSVRAIVQNVEDALAAQRSADQRGETSRQAVEAGRITLRAKEASWRAGAISVFELEDARRQFNSAQESEIAAARDRAQAWIDLVRASGDGLNREDLAGEHTDLTHTGKQPG